MNKKYILSTLLVLVLTTPILIAPMVEATTVKNLIVSDGVKISGFDSTSDWIVGGSGAYLLQDHANFVEGTSSLMLTMPSGNAGITAYMTKTIALDLSSATVFSIWVYYYDTCSVTVQFSSTTSFSQYFSITIPYSHLIYGWNHLVLDPKVFTNQNGESWANTMVRIRIGITPYYNEYTSMSFDDLTYNLQAKAKCVITFDDGDDNCYLKAKPIMDANNQKGVSFVITSTVGQPGSMTISQLNDLFNEGWDISDHSQDHLSLSHLSAKNLDTQVNGGYRWLVEHGFVKSAIFFANPNGSAYDNQTVINKIKENHIFARSIIDGTYQALLTPSVPGPQYALKCIEVFNLTPVATVEALIDQSINQKGLLILLFHNILDSGTDQNTWSYLTSDFQTISNYLASKSGGIDVVTFSDLVDFTPTQLTITASASSGGSISPVGNVKVNQGSNQAFTISANTGYQVSNVLIDGVSIGAVTGYTFSNVQADHTITAAFTQIQYTMSVSTVGQGSVSKSPDQASYASGSTVQLTATPAAGWAFTGWSGDLTGSVNPTTITVNGNKAVTATFTLIPTNDYTMSVSTVGQGSVSKSPNQTSYASGSTVQLTATPAAGWVFSSWSGDLSGSTNPATITMDGNKAVTATFTQIVYTLAVSTVGQGTVSKNPDQASYASGSNVQLTATPATGWTFTGWSGDLTGSASPTTITMDANKVVTATFTQTPVNQYTLTVSTVGSGTVSLNPSGGSYASGTVVTVTATPATGWVFSSWSGDLSGSTNPATITMDANKAVTATFTQVVYTLTITVSPTTGGTVTPSISPPYHYGDVVVLTESPSNGYSFSAWSGDGTGTGTTRSVTMTANRAVTATFTLIPINDYTLTISTVGQGSVSKSPDQASYASGSTVQLTATPAVGWAFSSWSGDLSGSVNPTTITVNGNKAITATFSLTQFTITASAGSGGSISPSGSVSVSYGSSRTFTITPKTGYHVVYILVDGSSVGSVTSYTFTNVQAVHTIAATFAINTYTITVTQGTNGVIAPGTTTVNYGVSQRFTIKPNTGYHIVNVVVDGVSKGAITSYTFTSVKSNHQISASFAINTYTITSSAGSGGTITPKGTVTVNYGASQTFTITPNTGYHIVNVVVDGVSKGAITSYTFTSVKSNHKISVTFARG